MPLICARLGASRTFDPSSDPLCLNKTLGAAAQRRSLRVRRRCRARERDGGRGRGGEGDWEVGGWYRGRDAWHTVRDPP
jgi:hypothetical protein